MKNILPNDEPLIVGSLKFTTDLVSKRELYEVLQEALQEFGDKVHSMMLRTGAPGELAVDIIYQPDEDMYRDGHVSSSKYLKFAKKYFEEKICEGCIKGWDISGGAIVLK